MNDDDAEGKEMKTDSDLKNNNFLKPRTTTGDG